MRRRKSTFEEMVERNKEELLRDEKILEKIEEQLEEKFALSENE